eukprot:12883525-Alexandrium_andersonii.AAC.1
MSASLVGSEMCIRDRPTCVRGARSAGRAGCDVARLGLPSEADLSAITRACLLYTSDAADDM